MTDFKVGDRVRDITEFSSYGDEGVVVAAPSRGYAARVHNDRGGFGLYRATELELLPPVPTVEVVNTILVRFPGEDGAHELTKPEAYALFRALERIV